MNFEIIWLIVSTKSFQMLIVFCMFGVQTPIQSDLNTAILPHAVRLIVDLNKFFF